MFQRKQSGRQIRKQDSAREHNLFSIWFRDFSLEFESTASHRRVLLHQQPSQDFPASRATGWPPCNLRKWDSSIFQHWTSKFHYAQKPRLLMKRCWSRRCWGHHHRTGDWGWDAGWVFCTICHPKNERIFSKDNISTNTPSGQEPIKERHYSSGGHTLQSKHSSIAATGLRNHERMVMLRFTIRGLRFPLFLWMCLLIITQRTGKLLGQMATAIFSSRNTSHWSFVTLWKTGFNLSTRKEMCTFLCVWSVQSVESNTGLWNHVTQLKAWNSSFFLIYGSNELRYTSEEDNHTSAYWEKSNFLM